MSKNKRILVTGASGMVGKVLVKRLTSLGFKNILKTPSSSKLDLKDSKQVNDYFEKYKPRFVYHLAAKVGGIQSNIDNPVEYLLDNALMNCNVLKACSEHNVEKVLYLGSSCIYPTKCKQPMKEEYLLSGKLEPTNEGYALSKIMGLKLAEYYCKQYGLKSICLMPPNLYHEDKVSNKSSHVFEDLIKRIYEAKYYNLSEMPVWGNGKAKREFMHVNDLVDGMLYFMDCFFDDYDFPSFINIGVGKDYSIKKLVKMICKEAGYKGKIIWDKSKPNGMKRKCMDVTRMKKLGFTPKIKIDEGIKLSINKLSKRGGE